MNDADPATIERVFGALRATLGRYHRYALKGGEHIPKEGGALGLISHGIATYDLFLAAHAVLRETGRPVRMLGDAVWFRVPGASQTLERLGMVNTRPDLARRLLDGGNLVAVAPGGMREALRPSSSSFRVDWAGRRGFARLALEAQRPVVLLACPSVDRVFTVYDSRLTRFAHRRWGLPLPLLRGLGPTLIPRPVRLTTHISSSLLPPAIAGPRATDEEVESFRSELEGRMNGFLAKVCAEEGLEARSGQRHAG